MGVANKILSERGKLQIFWNDGKQNCIHEGITSKLNLWNAQPSNPDSFIFPYVI
jgi:hypothetical protein